MKTDDIINVNYTTEIHNMLIFARTGVMKDYKKHVFITHFPPILGQILIFSSKNIEKFRRGATNHHIHKMTKEKIFLLLTSVAGDFFAPRKDISVSYIKPPHPATGMFSQLKIPMQRATILGQPTLCTFNPKPVQFAHRCPEFRRMIHMFCVCQFMHHNISHYINRCERQPPRKRHSPR